MPFNWLKNRRNCKKQTKISCTPMQQPPFCPTSLNLIFITSGAPLFQFSYLCQDFTSAGHWFPEFPKESSAKLDAALSSIQTLPLFEPRLTIWFIIFHGWGRRCVMLASSPDSDAPRTKRLWILPAPELSGPVRCGPSAILESRWVLQKNNTHASRTKEPPHT